MPATMPSTCVVSDVSRPAGVPPSPSVPIGSSCAPVMTGGVCVTISSSPARRSAISRSSAASPRSAVGQPGDDERPSREQPLRALGDVAGGAERRPRPRARCGRRRRSTPRATARVRRRSRRPRAPSAASSPGRSFAGAPSARAHDRRPAAEPRPAGRVRQEHQRRWALGAVGGQRHARPLRDVEQRLDAVVLALRRAAQPERELVRARRAGRGPAGRPVAARRRRRPRGTGAAGRKATSTRGAPACSGARGLRGRRGRAAEAGGERERDERRRRRERARGEAEPGEHQGHSDRTPRAPCTRPPAPSA